MNVKYSQKKYNLKIKEYLKHNELYYDKNSPIISDEQFDKLKAEILRFESNNLNLKSKDSPSNTIGFKPSKNFQKSRHRERMLSLSNVFNAEDLRNFEKKIVNYLDLKNKNNLEYSVEPKIDGISASLTYKKGVLIAGVSRGDGQDGELITENLKTIKDIPKKIENKNFPDDIDIRGEVFIKNSDFKKLKNKFANARNAASGSLRQKDPAQTQKIPLNFIGYTYGFFESNKLKKQSDFIKNLKNWGFKTNQFNKVITGIDNLLKYHKEFEAKRDKIDYDIDGLVYKVNDFNLQKRLGFVTNAPRWATAHKFSAEKSFTQILNIEVQLGRTGALTPVAKVKPVSIAGVVVSNATLHNEDEILRKDIRIGDVVEIERAGDVIPHVISVDLSKRSKDAKKYIFPKKCPSCGSSIIKEFNYSTKKYDAVKRCSSQDYECDKISIEKIKHFISKDALNIDGFGKKVVEKFWDLKFIRTPNDIFSLDYNKIEKLDGWGRLSSNKLKYSIDNSRNVTLDKLIFSLGIRHIGQENAKLIAEHIENISNLEKIDKNFNFNSFLNIDGIGDTQVNSLKSFFLNKNNIQIIRKLSKILKLKQNIKPKYGKFKNKTFLITGKLEGLSRAELKNIIEKNSGKILSSVTNKLDYLIVGLKPTPKKVNKANDLNIKLISQKQFNDMLE